MTKSLSIPNELWVVIDPSDNDSVYSAPYEEACHEHINEAIGEDIDGAGSWVVRRFVLAHEPPAVLDEQTLLDIANEYDQGPGATFEFDKATILRLLRSVAATVEGMIRDGTAQPPATDRIFPIARLRVVDDVIVTTTMYAPGLPDGEHDVYPAAPSQPPGALPAFKVGDRVIPTIAPHAKGDIRVRDVQTVYRISVDGEPMEAPYSARELVPYSTATKEVDHE